MSSAACIFCKIIKGDIPSLKLFENEKVFAFLDIQPLSRGHALVIPKFHGAKLTDIPDEDLLEILDLGDTSARSLRDPEGLASRDTANEGVRPQPVAKKIAKATGAVDFNILQNNGSIAHQVVEHVHFHMIPKPNEKEGLIVGWPAQETDMAKLKALHEEIKSNL
ncbi:hypothetical protein LT330_009363 [Penicillium expansum]|nr:hypothetical protein LT330_009363 [Penicillium expansum]